jgi:hypothetical protein
MRGGGGLAEENDACDEHQSDDLMREKALDAFCCLRLEDCETKDTAFCLPSSWWLAVASS